MSDTELADLYDEEETAQINAAYNLAVYHARNALFLSAGVVLLSGVIAYALFKQMPGTFDLLGLAFIFCTFIGLALWTQKKPYTALLVGTLVFLGYVCLCAIPYMYTYGAAGFFKGLYSGCLYKIAVLMLIAKAAPKAKQLQKLKEELKGNI